MSMKATLLLEVATHLGYVACLAGFRVLGQNLRFSTVTLFCVTINLCKVIAKFVSDSNQNFKQYFVDITWSQMITALE